jgi:hypothetical protein
MSELMKPLGVPTREACSKLRCGPTRLYALWHRREIEGFMDGGRRLWVLSSLEAYHQRRLGESRKRDVSPAIAGRRKRRSR